MLGSVAVHLQKEVFQEQPTAESHSLQVLWERQESVQRDKQKEVMKYPTHQIQWSHMTLRARSHDIEWNYMTLRARSHDIEWSHMTLRARSHDIEVTWLWGPDHMTWSKVTWPTSCSTLTNSALVDKVILLSCQHAQFLSRGPCTQHRAIETFLLRSIDTAITCGRNQLHVTPLVKCEGGIEWQSSHEHCRSEFELLLESRTATL